MEIYLIRHTTPAIEKGICYGQTDVALKDTFEVEAEVVLPNISHGVEVIYSSPLSRCLRLANYLSVRLALPLVTDHRLKELNFGEWESKRWNDIDPAALQFWMDDYVNVPCPGGESYQELAKRTSLFLMEVMTKKPERAAIVTHHGTLKAIHAELKKITLVQAMEVEFSYGSVSHYVI
jgi:alpha-ribazole phosphatase